ncbi:hypothetical protein NL388_29915, partial [Klebsiella pneumoniae]|nr:hypothetical protein [Klebsiella pneumoniae]
MLERPESLFDIRLDARDRSAPPPVDPPRRATRAKAAPEPKPAPAEPRRGRADPPRKTKPARRRRRGSLVFGLIKWGL